MKIRPYLIALLFVLGINQLLTSQNKDIEITIKRNDDKTVDLSYKKKLPGSYYIKLEFTNLQNCYQKDYTKVIKHTSGRLLTLRPINEKQHINFSYRVNYVKGHPNPKVDKDFKYVLPFKNGKEIKVLESTNLNETYFNAKKDSKWKSFIVDRTKADTIYSMRKGIVTEIKSDFKTDSTDAYVYTSKLNKIVVEHEDGTFSRYIGFNKTSIFVKLGQTVYPQTKLGVLDIFNNSTYRLYFDVAFLKDIDFNLIKNRKMSSDNLSEHVTPYFYSSNGPVQLKHNNEYVVEIDELTLLKEFSRKEKKKYKKNPKIFE